MKRKAFEAMNKAEKPSEKKELLNTLVKINTHIAELAGVKGSGRDGGGPITINQDNRQVTNVNVNSWSKDDLDKAKKILALKNSMTVDATTLDESGKD